jgi:hypothetical protein
MDQGVAINAVASLGGTPILVPRISFADPRRRHRGVSHHTLSVLRFAVRAPLWMPIPRLPVEQLTHLYSMLEELSLNNGIQLPTIDADQSLRDLEALGSGVTTMGRGMEQERPYFLAASGAGILAVQLAELRLF